MEVSEEPRSPKAAGPLDRPLTRAVLEDLFAAGCIRAEARDAALNCLRGPLAWWYWTNRVLLFLGVALVLAGVIFFFAFNWPRMGSFLKFALIEAALLSCLIAAWVTGLDRVWGKLSLFGASFLVGVLLAVYGQTYQTGADAYELFLGWSLLILGWVLISSFAPLWIMWLALLNLSVIFYWVQVALPNNIAEPASLFLVLALLNGSGLSCREYLSERSWTWLGSPWLRCVLLVSVLTYLTIPTILLIVEDRQRTLPEVLGACFFAVFLLGSYWYYRYLARDLFSLTLCALSFLAGLLTLIGRVMFEISDEAGMFLLFGFVIIGLISAMAFWLRWTGRAMEGGRDG